MIWDSEGGYSAELFINFRDFAKLFSVTFLRTIYSKVSSWIMCLINEKVPTMNVFQPKPTLLPYVNYLPTNDNCRHE